MANEIIIGNGVRLNSPELNALISKATSLIKLEAIQSAHTLINPKLYKAKMSHLTLGPKSQVKRSSIGKVIADRINSLPPEKKNAALKALVGDRTLDLSMRTKFVTTQVDLKSSDYVLNQVNLSKEFAFINDPWALKIVKSLNDIIGTTRIDGQHPPVLDRLVNKQLNFNLLKVKCVDETNPEWPGSDEIAGGGATLDDKGVEGKINGFAVGSGFDDGDEKSYSPPNVLKSFPLDRDYQNEKVFSVFFALAEKDSGGFADFLNDLYNAIKGELQAIFTTLGAAAGAWIAAQVLGAAGSIAGPLGTIIGIAAGAILGALVGWLVSSLKDDIFEPQMATIVLPSTSATFSNGSLKSDVYNLNYYGFGGQYTVSYNWELLR